MWAMERFCYKNNKRLFIKKYIIFFLLHNEEWMVYFNSKAQVFLQMTVLIDL